MAKDDVADDANGYHHNAGNGGIIVIISCCQGNATQIGSDSIAEIEGKLYHATSQKIATLTESEQEQLLGRTHPKEAEGGDAHQQHTEPSNVAEQEDAQQTSEHDDLQQSTRMSWTNPVAEHPACHVADHHSCACND